MLLISSVSYDFNIASFNSSEMQKKLVFLFFQKQYYMKNVGIISFLYSVLSESQTFIIENGV